MQRTAVVAKRVAAVRSRRLVHSGRIARAASPLDTPPAFLQHVIRSPALKRTLDGGELPSDVADAFTPAVAAFQERLGAPLSSPALLVQALTHKSFEGGAAPHNERLELLGSQAVRLYALEFLDGKYPLLPRETLESLLEAYTGRTALFGIARAMGVLGVMRWACPPTAAQADAQAAEAAAESRRLAAAGTKRARAPLPVPAVVHGLARGGADAAPAGTAAVAAKTLAALVGALYRDRGAAAARAFVRHTVLSADVDVAQHLRFRTPKRMLAAVLRRADRERPVSRLLKETGRQSSAPVFIVGVFSGTEKLGEGYGSSLAMAEHRAVHQALVQHFAQDVSRGVFPGDSDSEASAAAEEDALSFFTDAVHGVTPPRVL